MIIKGGARAGGADLAAHLSRADTNEHVAVLELRDLAGVNLDQALREMEALGSGTRCKSPLYHANIDPRANETMTREQWARAVDALEEKLGLTGQPRAVVQHVKDGRAHVHVVWSRIDVERSRAISDSHNYRKHEEVARGLEQEFGHARVQGAHVERDGVERPARTPTHAEIQQAERTGIDPKAMKAELSDLWQRTDTGKAFAAALEEAGYSLARGDKRDFIIVDQAGEAHSLARRIEGAKAKDIRARMADVDPAGLPDADAAKAIQAERARARADLPGHDAPEVSTSAPVVVPEPLAAAEVVPALDELAAAVPLPVDRVSEPPAAVPVPQAEPEPIAPAEPVPVVEDAARADQPAPAPIPAEVVARAPEPESEPEEPPAAPLSFMESVAAALAEQRRQLLDVLRRVWERRAEALSARAVEEQTPPPVAVDPPPVLPDADKEEKRRQLFDAVRLGRERERMPEAPPVVAEPAPPPEQAQPVPMVVDPPAIDAAPVPPVPVPEVPPIGAAGQRRQALDAEQTEAETKRRQQAQREAEQDTERRLRDPRIQQEEAALATQHAREEAADRKALEKQQRAEWRRLESNEAVRAKRDSIEDEQLARSYKAEDAAAKPRGLFAKLRGAFSPAAAQERKEEQQRIEAARRQDAADRLADRQARDAQARAALTAAQAQAKEVAERARAYRQATERELLRLRQLDREARELERERERQREREGREGRGGRGGRGGIER